MIDLEEILVSEEILEEKFCCNLNKCKGACCVEGDYGAPLEEDEIKEIETSFPFIKKYLSKESIEEIKKQGFFTEDSDGELVTPIMEKKGRCVYVFFDENNISRCSFERAHKEGFISWKKPISCHLYPIRVTKLSSDTEALNYHRWDICKDACQLGNNLKLPVYKFLKEPLIRKYGEDWYNNLDNINI